MQPLGSVPAKHIVASSLALLQKYQNVSRLKLSLYLSLKPTEEIRTPSESEFLITAKKVIPRFRRQYIIITKGIAIVTQNICGVTL